MLRSLRTRTALLALLAAMASSVSMPFASAAEADAVLRIAPATGSVIGGETFAVDIRLDMGEDAASAVLIELTFGNALEFLSADASGSIFPEELMAPAVTGNRIRFSRARFDTGFAGSDGLVLRLSFRALALGNAPVAFDMAKSDVLAYTDSSDILGSVVDGAFTIMEPLPPPPSAETGTGRRKPRNDEAGSTERQGTSSAGTSVTTSSPAPKKVEEPAPIPPPPRRRRIIPAKAEEGAPTLPCRVLLRGDGPLRGRGGKLLMAIGETEVAFSDLPTDAWFTEAIAILLHAGIATGYRDAEGNLTGTFGPERPVTYGEIAKMAIAASGGMPSGSSPENPTAREHWSAPFIAAAEEAGISVFAALPRVESRASRGAVTEIILETLGIPIGSARAIYRDVPAGHPHAHAIATAAALGITRGDADAAGNPVGTFRPDDPVNRAEVAVMLVKAGGIGCRE